MSAEQLLWFERERIGLEMAIAGARQALEFAPADSPTGRALAALMPDFQFRLEALERIEKEA